MAVAIWLLLAVMIGSHSVLAQSASQPVYDCVATIKDAQVFKREQRVTIECTVEHTEELIVFTFPNGRLSLLHKSEDAGFSAASRRHQAGWM